MGRRRILLLAPHQDDECLQTAGVLRAAADRGEDVWVCFATNGEYEGEEFAAVRARESLEVLAALGVPSEHVWFLGYADTGMPYADSFLQRLYRDPGARLSSRWGRRETWTPGGGDYGRLRRGAPSPYTAAGFRRDLSAVLEELEPDEIYVTAPGDCHGDHDALGRFAAEEIGALRARRPRWRPELFFCPIHGDGEDRWPARDAPRFPLPPQAEQIPGRPERRPLPAGFSPADKRALIGRYVSQRPEAYGGYLLAFAKEDELLFRAP
jgi:LmbE family N-acetylglucosaminyl deacetylase